MANVRNHGPVGRAGYPENLNDGTMIRSLSPKPGTVAASEFNEFGLPELLRRLRKAANGIELHQIAVHLLGNQCFSVGVIAGIGLDVISSVADLLKLAYTFVLADLHDLAKGKSTVRAGSVAALVIAYFFEDELREAAAERDVLINELSVALRNPKEMFENITDAMAESYKRDWQEYQAHMTSNSLHGRYQAGVIFGRLLIGVLGLLTGIGGVARGVGKAATKLPKLLKHAKSVQIPRKRAASSAVSGATGGGQRSGSGLKPSRKSEQSGSKSSSKKKRELKSDSPKKESPNSSPSRKKGGSKPVPQKSVGHRRDHILNRHRHGTGKSKKSEFPQSWDDDKIIESVEKVANDPKSIPTSNRYGSSVTGTVDGTEMRVDFYPDNHPRFPGEISTSYPVNAPLNP